MNKSENQIAQAAEQFANRLAGKSNSKNVMSNNFLLPKVSEQQRKCNAQTVQYALVVRLMYPDRNQANWDVPWPIQPNC